MTHINQHILAYIFIISGLACQPRLSPARAPSEREASAEQVLAAADPSDLHVFTTATATAPDQANPSRYLLVAAQPGKSGATYQVIATTPQHAGVGFVPRADQVAWVAGRVIEALMPSATTGESQPALHLGFADVTAERTSVTVAPSDAEKPASELVSIALPQPCSQTGPALLQGDHDTLHALLRCPREGYALLLTLDAKGQLLTSRRVPAAADATLFLHQPDGDYLAVARQILRVPKTPEDALPVIGTVPPPGGDSETRELVRAADVLLIVDGVAGRVIAMDALRMGWRYEKRFFNQGRVTRLRSLLTSPDRLCIVTAEETPQGSELFATAITLSDTSAKSPLRLALGAAGRGRHQLVPLADSDGGGGLLLLSGQSASGPALRLRRLSP